VVQPVVAGALGDCQLRRVLRFRDGKHASINLMHHRLLLPEQLGLIPTGQFDLRFGLPLGWYWCQHSMAAVHQVFGLGLRDARRQRRLLSRAGAASGDLFVTAAQVMNTAIATNWHVAAAHTKP
jgi:hypothetical protein